MRTGLTFKAEHLVRLVEEGLLAKEDRVELVGGELVWMAPIGARHVALVSLLNRLMVDQPELIASVQGPLRLGVDTELYPDLALCREDFVREGRVPEPRDAVLVVEVSDITLPYDLGTKLPRYAAAGVPELWVVDVEVRIIRTYADPEGDGYRTVGRGVGDEPLAPAGAPSLAITADELFARVS